MLAQGPCMVCQDSLPDEERGFIKCVSVAHSPFFPPPLSKFYSGRHVCLSSMAYLVPGHRVGSLSSGVVFRRASFTIGARHDRYIYQSTRVAVFVPIIIV